ncbi:MAG: methylenetetrahydrofolate reductase [NAD(P)H] [Aestuariivita sp.]|nr:methylenetetrahydrofolate reductase [NAD(P)H] [Aestuariivita sp.]MCY4203693.1 methylenetetrahydrofolate reductase [NAD(P)H] [Aestuariivita sp.]MCY4287025.1 methylenetetrahydrofolate reductase [NAD(P)H] [Aestuariivita sp.]MCY4347672.1 methylenetetrahydrofolate reductase [NAD(P)H] [Aestuariivita sp.]
MSIPSVSFEFFPPQSLAGSFRLWDTVQSLAPLSPRFVSVTYGAGGTTRELTREAVVTLQENSQLRVAAHLTCVNASRSETLDIAKSFAAAGVSDIVALRGDPPRGTGPFRAHPDGFSNSCELIAALRDSGDFVIRVGAYPDGHPEATDLQSDIEWLKRKADAGASEALTQFFFDSDPYFRFRDACQKAGVEIPIIPGILPIENWQGTVRFAQRCGAKIPDWLSSAFEKAMRDNRADLLATAVCTELCSDLIAGGVDTLHFYTLNRPELTRDVCFALGLVPRIKLKNVA